MSTSCPSALSDAEWTHIQRFLLAERPKMLAGGDFVRGRGRARRFGLAAAELLAAAACLIGIGGGDVNLERDGVLAEVMLQEKCAEALVASVDLHIKRAVPGRHIA